VLTLNKRLSNRFSRLTFTAISGRPINVLGGHDPGYAVGEVFILPAGAGGRTPTVTQFDLHGGYEQTFKRRITLRLFADIINLFNQQAVINVDDNYTYDFVQAIWNGKPEDLKHFKSSTGGLPVANSNYGNATAYQAPFYLRFGGRLSF
jgi:hypothetical protein